jgi:hypothetical protein
MVLSIPPEPKVLHPEAPPPGWRVWFVSFTAERKLITPRLQLIHTNAAENEGSIESSRNWSERRTYNGKATTLAHGQVDRDGDACLLLPLNRWPIVNARANPFSLGVETADRGWATDPYPTGSWFTEPQLQMLANFCAYTHLLFKIALAYPTAWDGNGTASHTEPFGYPYWTAYNGKTCPGDRKKQQVRDIIIPHARRIVDAWTGVTPPPPPIPPPPTTPRKVVSVIFLKRAGGTTSAGWTGYASFDGRATWQACNATQWNNLLASGHALDFSTFRKAATASDVTWAAAA